MVIVEEISKQQLKGELSPSLLGLKRLKHLDLSCNDFGSIQVPEFIGSLGNLRYLNLSSSGFSGIIPPQLGNISQLHTLCLGSFQDDVWGERTSVVNMEWLSNLRLLRHLDMSNVNISKAMDWFQVINTLPSLAELYLSYSNLLDAHPHVPSLNITSLTLLDLSDNEFIDHSLVPQWIWLHVSRNTFINSSLVLKELSSGSGSNLISLDISFCDISSTALDSLHNLTSLLSLDLSSNLLTNIIPKSLGNFCNLRDVDLSSNVFENISLTSLLESFLECKSPHLQSLSISESGLSGHLPNQLGQLMHMKHLDLSINQISGTIPDSIRLLSFLRTSNLPGNQISGPIPLWIGGFSLLEVLDLSVNHLNGSLPDSIGRLSLLKRLFLSYNQFNGSLPNSLGQLSKLEELRFSSNFLTGVVTETHLVKLVHLKVLLGDGNNLILRPRLANWIPPFQLQRLYLNSWNARYVKTVGCPYKATTLELLDLSSNRFGGKLPDILNGSILKVLDLSGNIFVGSLHHLLCSDGVKTKEMFNLGNNSLSGVIPECWEKWQSLSVLNLEYNNFSGGFPRSLSHVRNLQSLSMRGNKLEGKLPASLMNLTNLMILDLSGNELAGCIPSWVGTKVSSLVLLNLRSNKFVGKIPHEGHEYMYNTILKLMRLLDLSNNKLVGHIPSELTTLIELKSLNLSRNHLTGRIPEKIGDLKELESFDLSLNKLSGELPMSLSSLHSLSNFNVSYNNLRNHLTGRIPEKIGDLKELESFDLSLNKLSGELPMSLSSLHSLSNFNVSYNNLSEPCSRVETPDADQEEDDGSHGVDWGLIISVLSGFIAGFWVVLVPLIVSRSWRIAYFRFLSELGYMVYDVTNKIFSM
ncbi:leucine-rich repeat protein [Artemisia annua]|uniref:Leucine-rich repeat protein n=1 Tax=Artemisia annua TaxID=35608 RepID=A0A2U1L5H5_ARTAN|nr:leucine-rich repeat protein [Artemisia annua]